MAKKSKFSGKGNFSPKNSLRQRLQEIERKLKSSSKHTASGNLTAAQMGSIAAQGAFTIPD